MVPVDLESALVDHGLVDHGLVAAYERAVDGAVADVADDAMVVVHDGVNARDGGLVGAAVALRVGAEVLDELFGADGFIVTAGLRIGDGGDCLLDPASVLVDGLRLGADLHLLAAVLLGVVAAEFRFVRGPAVFGGAGIADVLVGRVADVLLDIWATFEVIL